MTARCESRTSVKRLYYYFKWVNATIVEDVNSLKVFYNLSVSFVSIANAAKVNSATLTSKLQL